MENEPILDFKLNTLEALKQIGFKGFISIKKAINNIKLIPAEKGVYIFLSLTS